MTDLEKILDEWEKESQEDVSDYIHASECGELNERILKLAKALRAALSAIDFSFSETSDLYYLKVLEKIEEILK